MYKIIHHLTTLFLLFAVATTMQAYDIPMRHGKLILTPMADNAMRMQYVNDATHSLPEYVYLDKTPRVKCKIKKEKQRVVLRLKAMTVSVALPEGMITATNQRGEVIFRSFAYRLKASSVRSQPTQIATLTFDSPDDECLFGLGQFQDGYMNIRGLSRRLTQVNTQISIPMLVSNRGYGLLWNNYGLTEYNPGDRHLALQRVSDYGETETVDQTSTHGNQRETRQSNAFAGTIEVAQEGDYALLLDVGQTMARRHQLVIDGDTVLNVRNIWLPPTASTIVRLTPGTHHVMCQAEHSDKPVIYYRKVDNTTTLSSPVAESVDFTLFAGKADEVIATYRRLTGPSPMMPLWALGYIHCRERFHSSDEILRTAARFRQERYPIDLIVQDWQYWGPNGWNSMLFDKTHYPDPKLLVDSLHRQDMRFMLSVWSKIDKNSVVGKEMEQQGYYIPGTDWIDFFNPAAAQAYWSHFSEKLLKPYHIDAWWQDATEPENDDLANRMIGQGRWTGEQFRNMYTLLVSKTVYEGCRNIRPDRRTMILTRCGFPGIQRYNSAVWSGDVGHDFATLQTQITAGLNLSVTGLPWWTYDAGGFFRPGQAQYTDKSYHETMLRWLQTAVFLPLTRVHGYMSNTEFWNYGADVERAAHRALDLRYRLIPYIYAQAAAVNGQGATLLRPLVMDFAHDQEALKQKTEYMFGPSLLVCPVVKAGQTSMSVYLPHHAGGWYQLMTNRHFEARQYTDTPVSTDEIPVFVAAGTILPMAKTPAQTTLQALNSPLEIQVYPGQDADFTLYFDDGETCGYEQGQRELIRLHWDDRRHTLTFAKRDGRYDGMPHTRCMTVVMMDGSGKTVDMDYQGRNITLRM